MTNTFKIKPSKLKFTREKKTLDEIHRDTLDKFDETNSIIILKKQKTLVLNKKIEELSKQSNNKDNDLKINILKQKIKDINNEIVNLSALNNELDYFEKTRDILIKYYQHEHKIDNEIYDNEIYDNEIYDNEIYDNEKYDSNINININNNDNDIINNDINNNNNDIPMLKSKIINQNADTAKDYKNDDNTDNYDNTKNYKNDDILDRLNKLNEITNKNIKEKKTIKRKKIKEEIPQYKSILSYLIDNDISNNKYITNLTNLTINNNINNINNNTNNIVNNDKGTLKEQYLALTDSLYICEKVKLSSIKTCSTCNIETTLIHSEGIYVCQNCGKFEYLIIESEIPSHKDNLNEKPKYPYKTINHLIERLNQFQAKQTTLIPSEIYNLIKFELKKMLIAPDEISPHIIKKILKKYRLNTYYEHSFLIFSHITNTPPPSLTRDEEEKIKIMFRQTESPFKKFKPGDRSNYLNYSYVLHKLFLILADLSKNEDIIKRMYNNSKYFSLLKSRDKLRMQDLVWKNICKDLNWPYHPSF